MKMDYDSDSDLLLLCSLLLVFAPSSCVRTLVVQPVVNSRSFSLKCRCIRHRWLATLRDCCSDASHQLLVPSSSYFPIKSSVQPALDLCMNSFVEKAVLEFAPISTAQCVIRCMLHSGRQWFNVVPKQKLNKQTNKQTNKTNKTVSMSSLPYCTRSHTAFNTFVCVW